MKSATKKFAVLNLDKSGKLILPMNMNALKYIMEKQNIDYNDDTVLRHTYLDSDDFKSFVRMSRAGRYENLYTVNNETYPSSYQYMRMIDGDVKISRGFFNFLIENTGLKYTENEIGVRTLIADETLIPEGLTESFISKGKLVHKEDDGEIYGNISIMNYHFSNYHPEIKKQFNRFMDMSYGAVNFGFEAEKVDEDFAEVGNAMKLSHSTGFKKEYDGSLGSNGFELISPILPLYNQDIINTAVDSVKEYMNADTNDSCGGHINLSKNGTYARDILKSIKGSLPILYSIYQKRLDNRFCQAKAFSSYLRRPTKYSACYLKSYEILELRLFPAIKNTKVINNRIELIRMMMGELYGKSALKVIIELATPTSNIHSFMLNTILDGNRDKLIEKIRLFAKFSEKYGCGKISDASKKKVNRLMQTDVFQIQVQTPVSQPVVTPSETIAEDNVTEQSSDSTEVYAQASDMVIHYTDGVDVPVPSEQFIMNIANRLQDNVVSNLSSEMIRTGFSHTNVVQAISHTTRMMRDIPCVIRRINHLSERDMIQYPNRSCAFLSILSGVTGESEGMFEHDSYNNVTPTNSEMISTLNSCAGSGISYSNEVVSQFIGIFLSAIIVNKVVGRLNTDRKYSGWFGDSMWIRMYKIGNVYGAVISKKGDGVTYGFSYNEGNNTFRIYKPSTTTTNR